MHAPRIRLAVLLTGLLLALAPIVHALQFWGWGRGGDPRAYEFDPDPRAEFQFVRYAYGGANTGGWGRRGRGSWRTDYPHAEYHLTNGIARLTGIDTAYGGKFVDPMDEELFDHPWIYAVEVGRWDLADHEAEGCAST